MQRRSTRGRAGRDVRWLALGGGPNAYRCTIAVDDADAAIAAIEAHGGSRASATVAIPGVGEVAEFSDPECNLVCVMRYELSIA